jgi:hypothetical protein
MAIAGIIGAVGSIAGGLLAKKTKVPTSKFTTVKLEQEQRWPLIVTAAGFTLAMIWLMGGRNR